MNPRLLEQHGDHEETSELCCWYGQEGFLARYQILVSYLEPHLRRLTQKSEILAALQLIKAYIGFDGSTGPRITQVGIIARYNGKAFSFGLPGEVCHGVWGGLW